MRLANSVPRFVNGTAIFMFVVAILTGTSASWANIVGGLYTYEAQRTYVAGDKVSGASSGQDTLSGLSLDQTGTLGSDQATFHLHTYVLGYGPPYDGDWGTPGSPFASLKLTGPEAASATLSSQIDADVEFFGEPFVTSSSTIVVSGHVAAGDSVFFDVVAAVSNVTGSVGGDSGATAALELTITTPGDFSFRMSDVGSGYATHVQTGITYQFDIQRSAGEQEPSYVEVADPPGVGAALNGTTVVPEPSTLALACMAALGLAVPAVHRRRNRRS